MIIDLKGTDDTILVDWDKSKSNAKKAPREKPKVPLVYEELEIVKIER